AGEIGVLVNCAAIWHPTPLESVTPEMVDRYWAINARAGFLLARAAGLRMVQQSDGGSIVNIGDWGCQRPYIDHAAYFPSKGSIETMTRSLAVELGRRNPVVRVNCVHPGPVLLPEDCDSERALAAADSTLVGRVGTAEEVAHAVQFLCENQFVTGSSVYVDGGRAIYANEPATWKG
ncbi:MAG: SDR family oxidoreductase, partial [Planctomycetota bacterium]